MAKMKSASEQAEPAVNRGQIAVIDPPRLPYHASLQERYGVSEDGWRTVVESIFPSATSVTSVVRALAYCKQRNLDVYKRPIHIVPIYSKELKRMVDTIWPGISELRTTASRTGNYAGCDEAVFGPSKTKVYTTEYEDENRERKQRQLTVTFPEWCQVTLYRNVNGQRCKFVGPKVIWQETYATYRQTDIPNEMWQTRPEGQLEKCAEAAALRRAFPEEIGGEYTDDEVGHVVRTEGAAAIRDKTITLDASDVSEITPAEQQANPEPKKNGKPDEGTRINNWLEGLAKRLTACADRTEITELEKTYIEPYRMNMPAAVLIKVKNLINARLEDMHFAEEAMEQAQADSDTATDEPPF